MDIHPLTRNEIARLRSEEKVSRGLAAHAALRALEAHAAELDVERGPVGRRRFVGRLRWREVGTREPTRPAI